METATWNRIKDLYAEALERPAAERGSFLDQVCRDDEGLRRQIESLLAADAEAGTFMSQPVVEAEGIPPGADVPVAEAAADRLGPGQVIDRYTLTELLGEGGFGSVYAAEQREPVRRRVALKVIKLGMDTRQVAQRFEAERQALAMMDHPGIAKVFDGGATANGRPYFVMELVDGVPITEYARRHGLSRRQRLAMFLRVCEAVQHAHQKGVIHRDLKPSNVLVTQADGLPVPKVIDFGVAKALHERLTEHTLTQTPHLVGTPAYMSPEQVDLGGDVDTRADVYSLGVLLYELLAGSPPFSTRDLFASCYAAMVQIIREQEPLRPSAHEATLKGDVDWIVMRAIEKHRDRRYDSVGALAEDVTRHLHDEPVLAGPPSTSYRMSKFIRRHRGLLGAVSVALAALVIGFGVAVVGFMRASSERDRAHRAENDAREHARLADTARSEAQAVSEFLQDMLLKADPARVGGEDLRLSELLDDASERAAEFSPEHPAVEASIRTTIGRTYSMIGRYDDADPHLRRALELRHDLAGPNDPESVRSTFNLASNLLLAGAFEEAEALASEAAEQLRRGEPDHPELLARHLDLMGRIMNRVGRYPQAAEFLAEALELFRGGVAGDAPLGRTLSQFGSVLGRLARNDEADAALQEALAITRRVYGHDSAHAGGILNNLAVNYRRSGKLAAAAAAYQEALQIQRATHGERHPLYVSTLMNLANLQVSRRDYTTAEPMIREVVPLVAEIHGEESFQYGIVRGLLAQALSGLDRLEEAEGEGKAALETFRRVLGPSHEYVATSLVTLASLQILQGKLEPAEAALEEALQIYREVLGEQHPHVALTLEKLGAVAYRQGDQESGRRMFTEALSMYAEDRQMAACRSDWAALECEFGDPQRAEGLYREVLKSREAHGEEGTRSAIKCRQALAECLIIHRRYSDAQVELDRTYELATAGYGADSDLAYGAARAMAELFELQGENDAAASWRARSGEAAKP